ncbi:MAG TPA: thiolase family protein, partial [Verrucomicrobiae bacterium]|nr:thiolase family protein [Verrucomicrobiae bacterium]
LNMGETAEVLYRDYGITREQQDAFALESHQKVMRARAKLAEEIETVCLPTGKYVDRDNGVRENQTLEALAKLRPIFDKRNGTVTAGNASQVTDGAVALLVMEEERARRQDFKPLGYLRGYSVVGLDPRRMGLGPAYAIPKVLEESRVKWNDIQLIEINEAFAVQVLAVEMVLRKQFDLEINRDLLNVNGGAIALGHPVGASGGRLVLTLLKEMKRRNLNLGLASACVGGGQGAALILERD